MTSSTSSPSTRTRVLGLSAGIQFESVVPLIVPSVDVGVNDLGTDVDFSSQMSLLIRKPSLYEWFFLYPQRVLTTRLLPLKVSAGAMETEWYFVDKSCLTPRVKAGLASVLVAPWYSDRDRLWYLWIVTISSSSWFRTAQPLFAQPAESYASTMFTIASDRKLSKYRVWVKPSEYPAPPAPPRPTGELLGEALGSDGWIRDLNHPVMKKLNVGRACDAM